MNAFVMTALAMAAFAANSVLTRLALVDRGIDAMSFAGIRLGTGALMLLILLNIHAGRDEKSSRFTIMAGGSMQGAGALLGYAVAFSLAYLMLGTGTGALVLFATVQIGMLGWAVVRGDRPGLAEWAGLALAMCGFIYLVSPGLTAPAPLGVLLMVVAGGSWAAYSLIGRGSRAPLADTAGNFTRCAPAALALLAWGMLAGNLSMSGIVLAAASGALASGVGYAIWYAVLPSLGRSQAAVVQLTVPVIAATGGIAFVGEQLTARLVIATLFILGGVALALLAAERRKIGTARG